MRGNQRRCVPGRRYALLVLNDKREVGRVAGIYARSRESTRARYKAELETAKARRLNSINVLAQHDLSCDVCGRGVS